MVKSNILPYKFAYLSMVKNVWPHSKNIEHGQKILNETKNNFELADGLGKWKSYFLLKSRNLLKKW